MWKKSDIPESVEKLKAEGYSDLASALMFAARSRQPSSVIRTLMRKALLRSAIETVLSRCISAMSLKEPLKVMLP